MKATTLEVTMSLQVLKFYIPESPSPAGSDCDETSLNAITLDVCPQVTNF